MADPNTTITPVPAIPNPIPTPAPVVPVAAVVETPVTPPVIETPVVVAQEAAPVETVLGEALKPVEPVVAPVEIPPIAEAPKADATKTEGDQSVEPAPPPKYEPFKIPEGFQADQERLTKFTDLLGDLEVKGKAEHSFVQEFGQKAVEFHLNEVKNTVDSLTKLYQTTWENQKLAWKDQFLKDPEMGGNKFQTTIDSALTFIRTHGGTAEQQAEFRSLMETSGLGNHPVMIRLLAKAGRAMSEGTPLAATKPVQPPKSKTQTMYGKSL